MIDTEKIVTFSTNDLLEALYVLLWNTNSDQNNSAVDAQLIIAQELINRKVVFWDSITEKDFE